jgi:hypothetical protein
METQKNVIYLSVERNKRGFSQHDPQYQMRINRMNKIELLEEMVRFQDERGQLEKVSFPLMIRGRILFRALEMFAETSELRLLASSYYNHLENEIEAYLKNNPGNVTTL